MWLKLWWCLAIKTSFLLTRKISPDFPEKFPEISPEFPGNAPEYPRISPEIPEKFPEIPEVSPENPVGPMTRSHFKYNTKCLRIILVFV